MLMSTTAKLNKWLQDDHARKYDVVTKVLWHGYSPTNKRGTLGVKEVKCHRFRKTHLHVHELASHCHVQISCHGFFRFVTRWFLQTKLCCSKIFCKSLNHGMPTMMTIHQKIWSCCTNPKNKSATKWIIWSHHCYQCTNEYPDWYPARFNMLVVNIVKGHIWGDILYCIILYQYWHTIFFLIPPN